MTIRKAEAKDLDTVTALALELWPDHAYDALRQELAELMERPEAAFFLLEADGQAGGFAQCQLRRDYVEGTETSPVGYLEGIYVRPDLRGKGGARALLMACEGWAASWGCTEFASDCELDNAGSLAFHLSMGFEEASRNIHFAKKIRGIPRKYKVITLCGSTKFKEAFLEQQKRLTLEGNIVISVGLFGHSGDQEAMSESVKEMLDDMHKRKIDMADEIFVINVGGYIGSSTKSEIAYARSTGKPVRYLEDPYQTV